MKIEINTQSSIRLEDGKIIYFDPFKITDKKNDATYIFITHDHYDHYDEESIKNVINENTVLIVPKCLEEQAKAITDNVFAVEPNKSYEVSDLKFRTTPAYNTNKAFHPKEKNFVGYVVTLKEVTYYVMGDTDAIEELSNIQTDVCFVPIGGTYTMDKDEAVSYVNKLRPKKVIPIHYGSIVGDITLGEEFKRKINEDIEVEIFLK